MSDSTEAIRPEPRHGRTRPKPNSVTIVLPRWLIRLVIVAQGTVDLVIVLIFYLYFANVADQRAYTKDQIGDLRSGICSALDFPPRNPNLDAIRDRLACPPYKHVQVPKRFRTFPTPHPSSSGAALSGPQSTRPVSAPAATPVRQAPASSRAALPGFTAASSTSARPPAVHRSTRAPQPPAPRPTVTHPLPSPTSTAPAPAPRPTPLATVVCSIVSGLPVLPPVC